MNEYTLVFARTRRRQKNNNKRNRGLLREDKTHTKKKKKQNQPQPKTPQFGVNAERDRGLSRGSFRDRFRQPVVSHARAMMMMMIKEVGRSDFVAVVRRRHQSFLLLG